MNEFTHNLDFIDEVVSRDAEALRKAHANYGDSWKKRGGIGAFMMLARKWDRLENRLTNPPPTPTGVIRDSFSKFDILEAIKTDQRAEGLIDDIRDLRRYLVLVEAESMAQGVVVGEVKK